MNSETKQILIQNLFFNVPFATIMVLVSMIQNGKGISVACLPMIAIAFIISEILGFVIPVQKISRSVSSLVAPGKNPMKFPQFFLVAAVLSVIFTVFMVMAMTYIGLKFDGVPMNIYWNSVIPSFTPMLITAYACVLIFLPLSMKISGLGSH